MKKWLIPFTVFENEIYFDRNKDVDNPFSDHKEPA